MRVSDQQMIALLQYQMNASYEDMTQAQTVLASGKSFRTPGENPIGAAVALDLQSRLSQNKGFTTGADAAVNWLQTTDTALSGVNDVLVQARTLAVQGANDTLSSSDRSALAGQVGQLLQQAVQSANANYDGQYVLSGFQTNTAPFALTGSGVSTAVTYQGDSGTMQRELSPGQLTQIG